MTKCNEDANENNQHILRDLCANGLRTILKNQRTATIDELARIGGLEVETARTLVDELCRSGEFIEEDIPGENGRRYRFNSKYKLILAICVLETDRVYIVVSDLYGEYLEQEELAANPDTLDSFDSLVKRYLIKYPAIALLAFGMSGFEDRSSGRLLTVDFPKLEWIHFRDYFMEQYDLPCIIENDVNATVLGYYKTRDFGENKCVGAFYFPQTHRPGGAICIDGVIHRGRDNAAGEVIFLNSDIRWKHFDYGPVDYGVVDVPKLICDLALPLVVYLNPDCLVIYGTWLPEGIEKELHKRLMEIMPREFLPDIVYVPNIVPDFLDGLINLALEKLEPKVDFSA